MWLFRNREEAGRELGARLGHHRGLDTVVMALPRGGVPVGAQVAQALGAPLEVFVVRKIAAAHQPEVGLGAVGEDGPPVIDRVSARRLGVSERDLEQAVEQERVVVSARVGRFREGRPLPDLSGRTVIVVDDGIATGSSMAAALAALRARGPARLVVAVPVSAGAPLRRISGLADETVCLAVPERLSSVGLWYRDFREVTDQEVAEWLGSAADEAPGHRVDVPAFTVTLAGLLALPEPAIGVVVVAHGRGSSLRNRGLARQLRQAGLGTLLFDLLSADENAEEALTGRSCVSLQVMAERWIAAHEWLRADPRTAHLPIGYLGASTSVAAALMAASLPGSPVFAVVSRGGRPDLAGRALERSYAPVLLIVGERDPELLALSREAMVRLRGERRLVLIPGASALFEEPGSLEEVGRIAARWLVEHLRPAPAAGVSQHAASP